jgi:hypothetical protein
LANGFFSLAAAGKRKNSKVNMRFRPCQATTVGQRPVLADGEIIIHLQPEIGLYNKYLIYYYLYTLYELHYSEDRLDKYGNGTGYLTNHRFIWCDGGTALAIPLVEVAAIDGQVNELYIKHTVTHKGRFLGVTC